MSDYESFVNLELPRRPVTLTLALTGWDADPNGGGAPAVIANAPVGTWFRELTATKWWRKSETVWEESGSGPGPGSADKLDQTTGPIELSVDPATGVSPAAGTIVHNQTEYATLGHPVRLIQDALRILPLGVGHLITIWLEDGTHLADVAAGAVATPKEFINTTGTFWDYSGASITRFGVAIQIRGRNKTILEAEQGGTLAADGITVSGTPWTPDEFKGKFIAILTGAGAGYFFPVRTNTDNTVKAPDHFWGLNGACTFEIYEPTALILSSSDGINQDMPVLYPPPFTSLPLNFENVKIGSAAVPLYFVYSYGGSGEAYGLYYCMIELAAGSYGIFQGGYYSPSISSMITGCAIHFGGADPFWIDGGGESLFMLNWSVIHGASSLGYKSFIYARQSAFIYIASLVFVPDAGWAGSCIYLRNCNMDVLSSCYVYGNDVCTAIRIEDVWEQGNTCVEGHYIYASHCAVVAEIIAARSLIGFEYAVGWYGDNNGIGWNLSGGALVRESYAARMTHATTPLKIDGVDYSAYYGGAMVAGDQITGPYGSSFMKVTGSF
jgi:hypothetical protein